MSEYVPLENYPDKAQVTYVKDPTILRRYFKNHPEDLDEAIQCIGNALNNSKQREDLITAELHLEQRTKSHDPVDFPCSPQWTILSAKIKICELFPQYSTKHLYVLHKRRIAKDWVYLKDCDVEEDGDVLYVYIHLLRPRPRLVIRLRDAPSPADTPDNSNSLAPVSSGPASSLNITDRGLRNFAEPIVPGNFSFTTNDFSLPPAPDGAQVGKLWTCAKCTFLNEEWRPGCCMCSSPRPTEEAKPLIIPGHFVSFEGGNLKIESLPKIPDVGWRCPKCTFLNEPTRPGCEMCSVPRPADYEVPKDYVMSEKELERINKEEEEERAAAERQSLERRENYFRHISVAEQTIIQSTEPVECMICFTKVDPSESIVLRECLHRFCKECIGAHVKNSEEAIVTCPFMNDDYKCNNAITHQEIQALLSEDDFQKFLDRGLMQAEKESPNSFHCKTPDCNGWCVYEDQVNTFHCPVCKITNCLTCKAIHEGKDCKEYQDELTRKAATDEEAKKTKAVLDKMLQDGDAMHCPQCNIIIQKKVGCDWIRCPMCKLEICWVTKGRRWGPGGKGDVSGGCRCRVGGKRCHNECNNCH